MKKIFEWIGGFALIAFSFYFTDKVSLLIANKSDLMEEIKSVSGNYKIDAVDAIIDVDKNTIIPGKYGKEVDDVSSYMSMHEFGIFNENYLIYKSIKPKTSLEDNKDKYILKGNSKERNISFILETTGQISEYLDANNYEYDVIAYDLNDLKSNNEYINGAYNKDDFKSINKKVNHKICIKNYSNIELCKTYNYYIIAPNLSLNINGITRIKSQLSSGSMVLILKNSNLDDVKYLIKEAKFKDLKLVKVSKLISEE